MNIKSLLIGSAAALATVSGSYAADAVVAADPEPMEYVRVCDAYGAGYFYIPGTETCLKIGGWVRYEINMGAYASPGEALTKRARGRLEIEAKNESELGTVASYFRIDSNVWSTLDVNGNAAIDPGESNVTTVGFQYSLGVGGLEMGRRDSQWNRFSGYGGVTDWGGTYGYQERHYISYTFSGNNFSAIVSLDHDEDSDYMPDVMAGVAGTFGKVNATLSAGWDTSDSSVALKGTLNAAVGPATLRLVALYSSSATNQYADWTFHSPWSVIAGVSAPLGQKASAGVDFQYFGDGHFDIFGNVNYTIAPGLTVLVEGARFWNNTYGGMVRFERAF